MTRVDTFDADFFGVTPREAERMDPQQRLLAELCWEAFENAGISLHGLDGSNAGVFVGIGASDYLTYQLSLDDSRGIDAYTGTGNAHSLAANRLSYLFNLHGPSVAMDTACSSSLVAFYLGHHSNSLLDFAGPIISRKSSPLPSIT